MIQLPPALLHVSASLRQFDSARRSNPLKYYTGNGRGTHMLFTLINRQDCDEVWWCASNSGGKTYNGASLCLHFALNKPAIDGYPIPQFGWGNVGWVIAQSYKQQVESSQKAYLELLGDIPHDISWADYGKGYIDTIYVAGALCSHPTEKHCQHCSRIVFHCARSDSSIGGRIDWAHADEPPPKGLWGEIRARRSAGKKFKRIITATALRRRDWEWMRADFEGSFEKPHLNRAWFKTSLYDNNKLRREDIEKFEADWARDPLCDARLMGDFVDEDFDGAYDTAVIQDLQRLCARGQDIELTVKAQQAGYYSNTIEPVKATVEQWWGFEEDEEYLCIIDPSQGIRSARRDPGGIHVYATHIPRLVMRHNSYLGAYGLGYLAAMLGFECGERMQVDIDMTGGYGTGTLLALQQMGYRNLCYERYADRPGIWSTRVGFRITPSNRGELISTIQDYLSAPDVMVYSRDVFDCLLGVGLTHDGKVAAIEGSRKKDEDMICLGRGRWHLVNPHNRAKVIEYEEPRTTMEAAIHQAHGRPKKEFVHPDDSGPELPIDRMPS